MVVGVVWQEDVNGACTGGFIPENRLLFASEVPLSLHKSTQFCFVFPFSNMQTSK